MEDSPGAIRLVRPQDRTELTRLEAPEETRLMPRCFTPDGTRLIAVGVETQALHIWDLRAIRAQLAALRLDWDLPPYPEAAEAGLPKAIEVRVGKLDPAVQPRQQLGRASFVLAFFPLHWPSYRQRGGAYAALGEPRQAIRDYTLALRLASPDKRHRIDLLLRRANAYRQLPDLLAARADLERVLALQPDHRWASRALAWWYVTGPAKLHAPAKALPPAEKAVRQAPGDSNARNTLGVVYYRLGRYERALVALERSLRESKGTKAPFNLLFLALCHARLGDPAQAQDCYDRALRWLQDHWDGLTAQEREELDAFKAEARPVLEKGAKP